MKKNHKRNSTIYHAFCKNEYANHNPLNEHHNLYSFISHNLITTPKVYCFITIPAFYCFNLIFKNTSLRSF